MFVLAGFPVAMLSDFEFHWQDAVGILASWSITDQMLCPCCFFMDRQLLQCLRYIISLSSLAYIFTTSHIIQYTMWDQDNNNTGTGTLQDHGCDLSDHSALTLTHDTQPTTTSTSESIKKTSSWWTDNEITLLLNYVELNCTLTTARGLTLKKSEFNKACATEKSKDATQCHYKWGQVHVFQVIIIYYLHYLSELYVVMLNIQSNLAVGQEVW